MARIPGEPDPSVPESIDFQTPEGQPAHTPGNEDRLRTAAERLGWNYDNLASEELAFLDAFEGGGLDSLQPEADPENPLIPGEASPDPAPTEDDEGVPPPAAGAEESGRADATTPDSGEQTLTEEGAPAATSQGIVTPGLPAFDIPPTLPPAQAPPPAAEEPQMVQLQDGSIVTLETYQQMLAQQQAYEAAQQQQPPAQVPNAWTTTPGEYVDERAALEIAALQERVEQINQQTYVAMQQQRSIQEQAIEQAVAETKVGYGQARGLSPEQVESLFDAALQLQIVGVYAQQYPGDPRRAVAAAMENVYWQTPELRDLEIQRRVEEQRVQNAEVDRKKALAGQTVSPTGSVPRVAAPPKNEQERMAGMSAMIEADPTFAARQAQR